MLEQNISEEFIAIYFAIIIIPLILLEFEVGKISEKIGFRKFFIFGFGSLTIISIISYFSSNIYLTITLLALASFAMAFLEPLQDSYFFKLIKEKDEEKFYPIYATAGDIGGFIGKIIISITLLFLPNEFAYLSIAILMGITTLYSFKVDI